MAFFYFKMAKKMPRKINNNEDDDNLDQKDKDYKAIYLIGIVLNGLFPIV